MGPEQQKMMVHSPGITAHSWLFTAALKKDWIEGQNHEVKGPEAVAYHIEYMHSQKLPTRIYTTTSPGAKKQGYKVLA